MPEHNTLTSIHRGAYIQSGDPGAVGAKVLWFDTAATPPTVKKRNDANNGWDALGFLSSGGGGGFSNPGSGANSERFGLSADTSTGTGNTAIGNVAFAGGGSDNVALGYDARTFGSSSVSVGSRSDAAQEAVVIGGPLAGQGAQGFNEAVVIGCGAVNVDALAGVNIGYGNRIDAGSNAVTSLGASSVVTGGLIQVLGDGNVVNQGQCIVLGASAFETRVTGPNQFTAGSNSQRTAEVYFDRGVRNAAPIGFGLLGTAGLGNDISGGYVEIGGGLHTGTPAAVGGEIRFSLSGLGAGASSLNTRRRVGQMSAPDGNTPVRFDLYNVYSNNGADTEYAAFWWNFNTAHFLVGHSGAGVARALILGTNGAAPMHLRAGGANHLSLSAAGVLSLAEGVNLASGPNTGSKIGTAAYEKWGFWGANPIVRPTVTGNKEGNVALTNLVAALASAGLIDDATI